MGHKMSKSLGNIISPKDITKKYGTDTLRLKITVLDIFYTKTYILFFSISRWWVASHGTQHMSITVSDKLFQNCAENLSKIRSTLRYLNGAIGDNSRTTNKIDCENKCLSHLDRYLLSSVHNFENEVNIFEIEFSKSVILIKNVHRFKKTTTYTNTTEQQQTFLTL